MKSAPCSFSTCRRPGIFDERLCIVHHNQKERGEELRLTKRQHQPIDGIDGKKRCNSCERTLSIEEFSIRKEGRYIRCAECESKIVRAYKRQALERARERHKKTGDVTPRGRVSINSEGYAYYRNSVHPIAIKNGYLMRARYVLYNKLDGKKPRCYWCNKPLLWKTKDITKRVTADHLNWKRDDDRPQNIVPACQGCNAMRKEGFEIKKIKPKCKVENCKKDSAALELCRGHYMQQYNGNTLNDLIKRLTDEEKEEVVERLERGETISAVAAVFEVTESTIGRTYKKYRGYSLSDYRKSSNGGGGAVSKNIDT